MAQNDLKPHEPNRVVRFYHEVKSEMRKVTWPTRSELYGATIVVTVVTIGLSVALGLMDAAYTKILELLYSV